MLTLRCTQRVRKRLRLPEQLPEAPALSGALGDWYAHLVRFGHSEFAIVTSERCLLTMLLPARELRTSLVPNLHASLRSLLERLDVSQEQVSRELDGMQPVSFARATNRRVLGSMNDLAFQARHHLAHGVIWQRLRSVLRIPPCLLSERGRDTWVSRICSPALCLPAARHRACGDRGVVGALKGTVDAWFDEGRRAQWPNMAALKQLYRRASVVSADRVVFNIKGNDYRLVTAMDFEKRIVWIKSISTHSEYERIDVKTVAYERPKADSK